MLLSRGDPFVFVTRPISAITLLLALLTLILVLSPVVQQKREEAFQGD
jgi:TctA family transporter